MVAPDKIKHVIAGLFAFAFFVFAIQPVQRHTVPPTTHAKSINPSTSQQMVDVMTTPTVYLKFPSQEDAIAALQNEGYVLFLLLMYLVHAL